ncbi:hypothetical protein U8P76_05835 [Rhizobium johnstonii]|nr:hypothetical protein U8P76_05835 [Rhizobium johnstonii]
MDANLAISLTTIALGAWAITSALEWYANIRLFTPEGLLSWNIISLRTGPTSVLRRMPALGSPGFVTFVLALRASAGLAIACQPPVIFGFCFALVIFISIVYMGQRACFGGDGSDQMGMVVTLGVIVLLGGRLSNDADIIQAGIVLIAGQSVLAYFIAGASKAVSPIWRGGEAVVGVMRTQTYGHPLASRLVETNPALAKAVCMSVIIFELLFPLVLFVPLPLALVGLAGFFVFHCINAYFMGLNAFVLPFVATYPSVLLCNELLSRYHII